MCSLRQNVLWSCADEVDGPPGGLDVAMLNSLRSGRDSIMQSVPVVSPVAIGVVVGLVVRVLVVKFGEEGHFRVRGLGTLK